MEEIIQEQLIEQENQEQVQEEVQHEDQVGEVQQTAQAQQESKQQENFRNLRRQNELLQKERDEYYRTLKSLEEQKKNTPEEINNLGPDDLVEWKHVQRELSKVKEELNSYKQQSYQHSSEARLKAQYPDFDKVVNETSIAALREQYPDLAQSLNSNPDVYSKASSVYTLVKKLGLSVSDETLLDRARAQENSKKPRPLSSISPQQGDTPLSKANAFAGGLTDELKSQLLKEMQEAKKRL